MTIEKAMEFLHDIRWQGSKPGLGRTEELLRRLGNPQDQLQYVHVAGTNGKGSTCAMVESIIRESGYRTGMYTSPFLFSFNERIKVNGIDISDGDLVEMVEIIKPVAEDMEDSPTEFEIVTAMAFLYFARKKCDIVVLEVGMGGLLDSTNVIKRPLVAVITSISKDHVKELGPELSDIANNKAGIIKEGCKVALYKQSDIVEQVISNKARENGAKLLVCDHNLAKNIVSAGLNGQVFDFKDYKELSIPFIPSYQVKNSALAVFVAEILREEGYKITEDSIRDGLRKVVWPGRFQVLFQNPLILVDGSHNEDGMRATIETVRRLLFDRHITVIMGALADKDVDSMGKMAMEIADSIITVAPLNPRAMSSKRLMETLAGIKEASKENFSELERGTEETNQRALKKENVIIEDGENMTKAVDMAFSKLGENDVLLGIGSLYMVSDFVAAVNIQADKRKDLEGDFGQLC